MRRKASGVFLIAAWVSTIGSAAAEPLQQSSSTQWSRLRVLAPATPLTILLDGARTVDGRLVSSTAEGLTVFELSADLPSQVANTCLEWIHDRPDDVAGVLAGGELRASGVRFATDGLFYFDRRLLSVDDVLRVIPKTRVLEIRRAAMAPNKKLGGALIASGLASILLGAALKSPEGGPGPGFFLGAPLVGLGFYANHHRAPSDVVYRRE